MATSPAPIPGYAQVPAVETFTSIKHGDHLILERYDINSRTQVVN